MEGEDDDKECGADEEDEENYNIFVPWQGSTKTAKALFPQRFSRIVTFISQ